MIWKILFLVSFVGSAVSLMCYQCADSSEKDGSNKCQTYVRTMRKYQRLYVNDGQKIETLKYVKNCTGFANLPENETYCHITSVRQGDGVRSFIRDCSDGREFFGADFNNLFQDTSVINNNKTTCKYSPQGYLACVTLCGPHLDFCNGPESRASNIKVSLTVVLLLLSVIMNIFEIS